MFIFKRKILSSVLALTVCASGAAAQDSGAGSEARILGKVEVSAQKQVQDIQDVPIAVNVLSDEQIQLTGIDEALELANFVPRT
jgi:outer membrane receptor protein involved in Fe transport